MRFLAIYTIAATLFSLAASIPLPQHGDIHDTATAEAATPKAAVSLQGATTLANTIKPAASALEKRRCVECALLCAMGPDICVNAKCFQGGGEEASVLPNPMIVSGTSGVFDNFNISVALLAVRYSR
ncbi:hypothetical protein EJ07DRAFT_152700 [Lizonia empirigonia]|nr:hypothetical protein EJ07DRAFT_152700 [Lizonia empirigonia]